MTRPDGGDRLLAAEAMRCVVCGHVGAWPELRTARVGTDYVDFCAMGRDDAGHYDTECGDAVLALANRAARAAATQAGRRE